MKREVFFPVSTIIGIGVKLANPFDKSRAEIMDHALNRDREPLNQHMLPILAGIPWVAPSPWQLGQIFPEVFSPQTVSPWITIGIPAGIGTILVFLIYILILRRLVRIQTQNLQESEETYKRFFMTSRDPVFITTRDGRWVDCNQATLEIFGFDSKEELLQTSAVDFYRFPEDRPRILNEINQAGFVKDIPVEMVDKDGNVLHTFMTTSAVRDKDGKITGYQGTIRDNTGWIQVKQEMEDSRESLDLAITGTGAGLWDWDLDTNQIMINDRFADIIGYRKTELTPFTSEIWESLSHPEDLARSNKLMLQHFAGDLRQYQAEIRMKHKSGSWLWVLNQGRVVERGSDRSPSRMVGTIQDITERVKFREDIEGYAEQLEALHEVIQSLSSTLSLNELLNLILVKLEETLAFDSASIFLFEDGELRIETVLNHPHPDLVVGKNFPTNNLLFQEMRSKKKAIIIDNAMRDSRYQGWGEMHHIRGWMGVPLVIQDNFIGYITMDSKKPSAFGSPEAKIASLFATQAAQAIVNARLYERVSQYAETLENRIEDRTRELTKMVDHMAGREIRMAELKAVIQDLRQQLLDNKIEPKAQDPLKSIQDAEA